MVGIAASMGCLLPVYDIPYKRKYWHGIYFVGLTDFSASFNIKSAINLATRYVDVITHVDQISIIAMWRYLTQMRSQDGNPCLSSVVLSTLPSREVEHEMRS